MKPVLFMLLPSILAAQELSSFGYNLFENVPEISHMPVSKDYPIGAGDEIIIRIGTPETPFTDTVVVVDEAGEVKLSGLSTINLSNVKASDLKDVIMADFAMHHQMFSGLARSDIRLGKLRGVVATIIGEVTYPGIHSFAGSSASLIQVLAKAGIKPTASLRRIMVDGKQTDLYQLLLYGEEIGLMLLHGAYVYVPLLGITVKIRGEVKRPAVYEMMEGEKLSDLVEFSGGFTPYSNPKGIQVIRHAPGVESAVIDVKDDLALADGDEVIVPAVQNPKLQKVVAIKGNVRNPKTYALNDGMTLSSLFMEAKPYEDSWPKIQLTRLDSSTLMRKNLEVSMAEILDGKDIPLQPMDEITVFSAYEVIGGDKTIEVKGYAKRPGIYKLAQNMSLRDVLFLAGVTPEDKDFFTTVSDTIIVMRKGDESMETMPVSLKQVFEKNGIMPQSGDMILLSENERYKRNVIVLGEVRTPGIFQIPDEGLSLAQLLKLAGLTKESFPEAIQIKNNRAIFVGDIDKAVLSPGDTVEVPAKSPLVFVQGCVKASCAVKWIEGKKADYYFKFAGVEGNQGNTIIVYANGRQEKLKGFLSEKRITPGSTLIVPPKGEKGKFIPSRQPPLEVQEKEEGEEQ